MQINRLFEIIYLLLERGSVTAAELAEQFEVSVRTIHRDLDILSGAGIPVYAARGKNGGIRLMEQFVLDRSLLSGKEQEEILATLHGMEALRPQEVRPVLTKLGAIFGRAPSSWLEADFSQWGGGEEARGLFELLKEAILTRESICFSYYNSAGEASRRTVDPEKLVFKAHSWYLYAFCQIKREGRLFKLTRIRDASKTGACFQPHGLLPSFTEEGTPFPCTPVLLRISGVASYRVYDSFPPECIERQPDSSFLVRTAYPLGEWVYSFLLSFGPLLEVLEPSCLRKELRERLTKTLALYIKYDT